MKRCLLLFLVTACFLGGMDVIPATAQPSILTGTETERQVNAALGAAHLRPRASISANRMFPGCATPLIVDLHGVKAGRVTVTCADTGWSRAFRVTDKVPPTPQPHAQGVLVLRESLARGTIIAGHHVVARPTTLHSGAGAITTPDHALGRRLRINLGAGQVLLARHLDQDWLVTKDIPVEVSLLRNGIRIELTGLPQAAAQLGEMVTVVNATSGLVLRAIVTGKNKVAVRPNMRRSAAVVYCGNTENRSTPCGKE